LGKYGEKTNPPPWNNPLIPILDEISTDNFNNKEPLLAALVVNKNAGIPGDDFFKKWMRLPKGPYPYPPEGPENQEIHELELKRVYDHWHDEDYKMYQSSSNIYPISNMSFTESSDKLNEIDTKKSHTQNPEHLENKMVKSTSILDLLNPGIKIGIIIGLIIGLMMKAIIAGSIIGLVVGIIISKMFSKEHESPLQGLFIGVLLGAFIGGIIGLILFTNNNLSGSGFFVGGIVGGITAFKILFDNKKIKTRNEKQIKASIDIKIESYNPLKLGVENPLKITVNNKSETTISNIHLITNFPKSVICNKTITLINEVPAGSSQSKNLSVTPTSTGEINLSNLAVTLEIDDFPYEKEPVEIGVYNVIPPEIDIKIDVPNPLKVGIENPVKVTVKNQSDVLLSNVQIETHFSKLIMCDESTVHTDDIPANSSEYTAIFITPRMADKINLGELDISYNINGNTYKKEPIAIGTYEAVETTSNNPTIHQKDINSDLSISRETEFYQGFIRFKMSVTNTSSFVVNDVALDFDYDSNLLRIDRHEPDYQIKNGRTIFGNISTNSSKTIAVYFDPMMCSKGTDINCQINYKDAKGQPQTTHMEPKQISVVCPIMETESDINIGRLKEFIEKLPYRDSKVYQVQNGTKARCQAHTYIFHKR
jgi:energy-coupling factor transporter transmembrane protein EcfT